VDSGEGPLPNAPLDVIVPSKNRGSADFDRRHILQAAATYNVPAPRGRKALRPWLEDWQVDAVLSARSGAPVTVTGIRDIGDGSINLRADVVPGVASWIGDSASPTGWRLNPAAFVLSDEPTGQGTLGRNTLRAFPLKQLDLALSRSIRIRDRMVVRLRLDAFNVFNVPNFGPPAADIDAVNSDERVFGRPYQSYADALGTGTLSGGGLTPVQQAGGPRSIQIGVRFSF
jgi:hypothetical protein